MMIMIMMHFGGVFDRDCMLDRSCLYKKLLEYIMLIIVTNVNYSLGD